MNFTETKQRRRYLFLGLFIVIALACIAACSAVEPGVTSSPTLSPAPTSAAGEKTAASVWLDKARGAAKGMNKYGFELQMNQKLTGTREANNAIVKIDMIGRAERNPLKLDQTINSEIDGETSKLRSIVVPDAYYMYLPEIEEWSKLSKDVSEENIKTLSDFQVNPEKALEDIQALGSSFQAVQTGDVITLRYEGVGPEAKVFLAGILESTMGLSGMETTIQESIDLTRLKVILTLDAHKHWPLSYRIESDMSIEFEPGQKSAVLQTLAGTYSKHNTSTAVTVPKDAQNAIDPDKMEEELDLGELEGGS
ncbi:DUF6612 family protein [Cohnella sp.]|uniref:DUF6612 family protein n=1 Tax=Cohnella sp. TaxID=1883426 RepID=UPI00356505DD